MVKHTNMAGFGSFSRRVALVDFLHECHCPQKCQDTSIKLYIKIRTIYTEIARIDVKTAATTAPPAIDNDKQNIQWVYNKNNVSFIEQHRLNLGHAIKSGRTNLHILTLGVKIVKATPTYSTQWDIHQRVEYYW